MDCPSAPTAASSVLQLSAVAAAGPADVLELPSAPDVNAALGADKAVVVAPGAEFPVVDVELEAEVHADATNPTAVPITTRVRLAIREVRRIRGTLPIPPS
jgi:hypothetical protein